MNLLICVNNEGYEASLEARKLYQRIDDERADSLGMVRVVDESGEDYLYPIDLFEPIHITKRLEQQLFMQTVIMPSAPVGKFKSFGPLGPTYEVGEPVRRLEDGDWMIEVTIIETGEKVEYRLSRLIEDPEAH